MNFFLEESIRYKLIPFSYDCFALLCFGKILRKITENFFLEESIRYKLIPFSYDCFALLCFGKILCNISSLFLVLGLSPFVFVSGSMQHLLQGYINEQDLVRFLLSHHGCYQG